MILKNNKRIDGCSDTVPVGTLNPFLGSTAPYGYLICQGQKVSKTTYKELYEICGDTFGQSTDTEFYLPDLRGQTIAGYKEGDSTFGTLGGLIGSLTHLHSTGNHTLTIDEMPQHLHLMAGTLAKSEHVDKSGYWSQQNQRYLMAGHNLSNIDVGLDDVSARIYTGNLEDRPLTDYTGNGGAHNHGDTSSTSSVQPTIVLNWIVKAFQLMPNQSYVSTVKQESDINTYSCNYINNTIPNTQDLGDIIVDDIKCKNIMDTSLKNGAYIYGNGDYISLNQYVTFNNPVNVIGNETYVISHKSNKNVYFDGALFYNETTYISDTRENPFKVPENANKVICNFRSEEEINSSNVFDVQLEKGSISTEYIPYKKFSYNSQESMGSIIVEDIQCKNLANIDNFIVDGKGTTPALNGVRYIYNLEPNTTYTLSFIKERISGIAISNTTIYDVGQIDFYSNGTKINTVGGTTAGLESGASKRLSKIITTPDNCDSIKIVFFNNNGDTNANTMVSKVQLEKGTEVTNYVPFKEFSNKQIYSTEEQVIGEWMGKPIYRKVYNDLTLNSHLVDVSNLSIETLVNIDGICYSSQYNQYKKANLYQTNTDYVVLKYSKKYERIDCDFTSVYTSINLVLEYTKTTD